MSLSSSSSHPSSRIFYISTTRYRCQNHRCVCVENKQVSLRVEKGETWHNVRDRVARRMSLPGHKVHLSDAITDQAGKFKGTSFVALSLNDICDNYIIQGELYAKEVDRE